MSHTGARLLGLSLSPAPVPGPAHPGALLLQTGLARLAASLPAINHTAPPRLNCSDPTVTSGPGPVLAGAVRGELGDGARGEVLHLVQQTGDSLILLGEWVDGKLVLLSEVELVGGAGHVLTAALPSNLTASELALAGEAVRAVAGAVGRRLELQLGGEAGKVVERCGVAVVRDLAILPAPASFYPLLAAQPRPRPPPLLWLSLPAALLLAGTALTLLSWLAPAPQSALSLPDSLYCLAAASLASLPHSRLESTGCRLLGLGWAAWSWYATYHLLCPGPAYHTLYLAVSSHCPALTRAVKATPPPPTPPALSLPAWLALPVLAAAALLMATGERLRARVEQARRDRADQCGAVAGSDQKLLPWQHDSPGQ